MSGQRWATVVVTLQNKQKIQHPDTLERGEAEKLVAEIGKARDNQTTLELGWLNVEGFHVLSAHIEPRMEPLTGL